MWEAVGKLFNKDKEGWDESDMRFVVEGIMRDWLKSAEVRCEKVEGGKVTVRVLSPILRQEVLLREMELKEELKEKYNYQMIRLSVTV